MQIFAIFGNAAQTVAKIRTAECRNQSPYFGPLMRVAPNFVWVGRQSLSVQFRFDFVAKDDAKVLLIKQG